MNYQKKKTFPKKPSILIVDDVARNLQIIGNLLVEQGYEISVAVTGIQAVETAKLIKPDLVLLDIMMPVMDGYEVCERLKNMPETKDIPIIFLTARNDVKDIVAAFDVGGVDYITKPFRKAEIIARINNQLELKFSKDIISEKADEITKINNNLEKELSIAAEYFSSLLPLEFENDRLLIKWKYVPSAKLGGDAFGYFNLDKDNFIFYLFDVCGHGIASGLYSVSVINNMRYQILPDTDFKNPEEVFSSLNKIFQITDHYGFYFTIWYGVYHIPTRELRYASAGHHPSILLEKNGTSKLLSGGNFIVGGLEEYKFKSETIHLAKNTDIYIYSDGAFEFKLSDGEMFSINKLSSFLEARRDKSAKELTNLFEYIKSMNNNRPLKDDFTILKITFK